MDAAAFQTDRFVLRAPRPGDAAVIAAMMTPAVSRWVGAWPVPFTPAMAAARIGTERVGEADGLRLPRVIERRADGAVLGWVSVARPGLDARRAVLSYWLGEAHHGQGTMREAATAMLAAAFAAWDVEGIEATTHPGNQGSAAVLRGCGMRHVGERTIFAPARAREEHCLLFEILRPVPS